MNDLELQIELRLETMTVPRDRVARIIWLHTDELEPRTSPAADHAGETRVQAVIRDGKRLTFVVEKLQDETLSGHSEFLGNCRVEIGEIDQLLIGSAIEQAATTLAFHSWMLKPAREPLAPLDDSDGNGNGSEGLESALVGKPAPDVELDLIDGKKFRLADCKNKVIVLDFWASWCGPCLQVMPQVDKVVREFANQQVELVAINLEETRDRIKAALNRMQIEPTVALDHDGRVAEKYGATTIPQTVIIDRKGEVARLFVGGGPHFDEQIREALRDTLSVQKQSD